MVGAAVTGRPIDRTGWPPSGPHRALLELVARVHEDNGLKSLRDIAAGMNLTSRSRVSGLLRGVEGGLPVDEDQLERLVRALGGGDDDVTQAVPMYRAARAQRPDSAISAEKQQDRITRVIESEPRALGVHAAIVTAGTRPRLPPYVERDVDGLVHDLLRHAAAKGGLVLLVGGSSTGKTRTLYEATRRIVPDFLLWQPTSTEDLRQPPPELTSRAVVWLDEFQHFVRSGLAAGDLRVLRRRYDPLIVVGTLWPLRYQSYSVIPQPRAKEDPYQAERELVNQAEVLTIDAQFSLDERERARLVAAVDPRIATALNSDYGLTQALAAAPALVQRWEHAPDRHTWALLTAAIDARRMGIDGPLGPDLLRAAVPGYLTPIQQARAPANWFEEALSYATHDLHGAVAALMPVGIGMGVIAGYTVADYLLQHGVESRRPVTPPRSAWEAYQSCLTEPADLLAAARAAEARSLAEHAENLLRTALGRGSDPDVRPRLARLMTSLNRVDEAIDVWRAAAAAEEPGARLRLASLLRSEGRMDEAVDVWRAAADAGDPDAHLRLASLLRSVGLDQEAIDALRRAVEVRAEGARAWLAAALHDAGRASEAIDVWRQGVADGEDGARDGLTLLLQSTGHTDQAIHELQEAVVLGTIGLRPRLAELLHQQGSVEDALHVWRDGVRNEEPGARAGLAVMLQFEGRLDEAIEVRREGLSDSDSEAIRGLAETLERASRSEDAIHAWHAAIAAGVPDARAQLTNLLLQAGRLNECIALWQEALTTNEPNAAQWLEALSNETDDQEKPQSV